MAINQQPPHWFSALGKALLWILCHFVLPAVAAWLVYRYLPSFKAPTNAKEFFELLAQVKHFSQYFLSLMAFVIGLICVSIFWSYYSRHVANRRMAAFEDELKSLKAEGLRLIPYGDGGNSNRYFFHADIWNYGIDIGQLGTASDLTVDFIFDGPAFQARNYILSPKYLRYFFWRVERKEHPQITDEMFQRINLEAADKTRAIRIVLVDAVADEGSRHDQDLLVYLNMSALAGYATFVVPKTKYERALPIIMSKISAHGIGNSDLVQFFEGHLAISAMFRDNKLSVSTAKYDKSKGIKQPDLQEVSDPNGEVRKALLNVALNYFCLPDARIPKRGGSDAINLTWLRDKLRDLDATTWTLRNDWVVV